VGAIGNIVPNVTRKAFERHGFPAGRLAGDWTAIVGEALAKYCRPERINWPRPVEDQHRASAEPSGATLVLRVDAARALDVQYRAAQIIERINSFLGYRAITEIRLVQAPIVCRLTQRASFQPPVRPRAVVAGDVPAGSPLAIALDRLAISIAASSRTGQA
jgi:hypothetical protein